MSGRISQNSSRQIRRTRRELSPVGRRDKICDPRRVRSDHDRYKNDTDAKQEEVKDDRDKDRKKRDLGSTKPIKRSRSPRRLKDVKNSMLKKDIKRNEAKEKIRLEKKSNETSVERHPLFPDNSRLSQLISQITNINEEPSRRLSATQHLLEYIYDGAHIEPLKRNCSNIFTALEEIFKERGHGDIKGNVVQCYAIVGQVLGIDCDKFFQWVFTKIPSAPNDQIRVLYLATIAQAIQLDVGKQVFYDSMPTVMASLQDVLENADVPELLSTILDILIIVARDYPHVFAEYFRDAVDILVGWHIDISQNDQLINKTADCLVSFHPYWVSDMCFSLTLLGQFLEDMEAYAEELGEVSQMNSVSKELPPSCVSVPKLTALIRVYTTVVSGMGEQFSPGREAKITGTFITDTVNRIIHCVDICGNDFQYEKLLISANKCLSVLVSLLGHNMNTSCVKLILFINSQLTSVHLSYNMLQSAVHLIEIVTNVGQSLPVGVVQELLEPDKPFLNLRCHSDPVLLANVLKIFQTLYSIKNIPLLEIAYKYFVKDITDAYKVLMECVQNGCNVEKDNEEKYDVEKAYSIIIFDLSALSEIATFKSSVIGAWKVEPPTFMLLTEILNPLHRDLMLHFPLVQFSILSCLFVHSQRCNHFIPGAKMKAAVHSKESVQLIKLLCDISTNKIVSSDTKHLCVVWLCAIINSISALLTDNLKKQWNVAQIIHTLMILSFDVDTHVCDEIANSIVKVMKSGLIHPHTLGDVLVECLPHLTNSNSFAKFERMMLAFPADIIASLPTVMTHSRSFKTKSSNLVVCSKKDLLYTCKSLMSRVQMTPLHSHIFKVIMNHLMVIGQSKNSTSWAEGLYFSCQRPIKRLGTTDALKIEFPSFSLPLNGFMYGSFLWFWLTWEAAGFCILSRLKTPLGKALDTFQTIEGVLKELEGKFKGNLLPPDKLVLLRKEKKEDLPKELYLHQAVVLLLFLENFEKLLYNAFEGTALSLPPSPRTVRTFFRTNRSTCCEWLNRIQESITVLSCMSGNPEKAVRNGFLWLQHLKSTGNTQGSDFERAMVTVVDALLQLHCHESIYGILEWSRKVVGRHFFWLYGSITKAKGSLEYAAEQFKVSLTNYLSPERLKEENIQETKKSTVTVLTKDPVINANPYSTQFLVAQTSDCYLQLCDWSEVQKWNEEVTELQQKYPSVSGLQPTIDISYIKAMMKFEDHDFAGVHEQLDMIPGATMSDMLQEQFPVLGTVKDESKPTDYKSSIHTVDSLSTVIDSMSPHAMLCQSRIYLMQALTLYWTSGLNTLKGSRVGSLHSSVWETVENLLKQANTAVWAPLNSLILNNSLNSGAPFLMQLKSIAAIRESLMTTDTDQDSNLTFMNVYNQTPYIDAYKTDISLLNEALRTASYLQFHHTLQKKGWVGPTVSSRDKLPNVQSIQVMTAKLSRIQGNKKLAESLLAKQLSMLETKGAIDGKMYLTGGAQLKLKQLSASVSSGKVTDHLAAVDILKESAKLKRTLGNLSDAIDVLCSSILLSERQLLCTNKSINSHSKLSEVSARSFVTLSKWILTEPHLFSPMGEVDDTVAIGPKVREVLKGASKFWSPTTKVNAAGASMSEGELACGQLLQHSTYRCPTLGKTWFAYADWCYKWGRKSIEKESASGTIDLLVDEKESILTVLPVGTPVDIAERVIVVISHGYCKLLGDEEYSEEAVHDEEDKVVQHLLLVGEEYLNKETVNALLQIWKGVVERVFSHYRHAANAYFTYLKLSGNESPGMAKDFQSQEYGNITATLRLLRLLVKYSGDLKQHLDTSFEQTPTKPWKGIIPQLFARLNHPEVYVQNSVANLLCRLAKDSPQLIVYQTVVGCSDIMPHQQLSKSSAAGILRAYHYEGADECEQPAQEESQISVADENDQSQGTSQEPAFISVEERVMQSSLHTILDALNEDNECLVQEMKCVVQELRRITLLWNELWLGSLTQLHQEAQRRMLQLEDEIKRVNANLTLSQPQKLVLIKEKHTALMKPLIYALERLQKITDQPPETNHERLFQTNYGEHIDRAIQALKNPHDPTKPEKSWESAKQLYQTLQSHGQKRPMSVLHMSEVSSILSKSKFSLMPIPGVEYSGVQGVTLSSFSNDIHILPTKTKPKKLVMIGSDGLMYPYLFKGLEDLHLDERIMQFLKICNDMFSKEKRSEECKYRARHYSVTPLGPRSGLIQWVDGATPLFTLYRRWQQREAAAHAAMKSQADKTTPQLVQPPMRPTELFYNNITPLLKEHSMDISSLRKEWPLSVLRKTLQNLSKDTPGDLLSCELWCSSCTASDWWSMTQTYSRSVAVMSMIGYVIGLGDRHLDNILIDLTSGEVIHIDYNVCFEKGKMLRVPEKVPFRMTPNMQNALGVSGVHGIFHSSCEKVMETLRQGREILLTLLEAFVYDPLVDWTVANDGAFAGAFYGGGGGVDEGHRYNRKEMERGITQTLLSTRVAEMKVAWSANRDELIMSLRKLQTLLNVYCKLLNNHWYSNEEVGMLKHQMCLLKAALVRPDHPLHSLQSRYDKQAKLLADIKLSKDKINAKLIECKQMQEDFQHAFIQINDSQIGVLYTEVCKPIELGPPSYSTAVSFLHSAGQSNIVSQCEQIELELSSVFNQRRATLRACLDSIISYSTIVNQFSNIYAKHGCLSHWQFLLNSVLHEPSLGKYKELLANHMEKFKQRGFLLKDMKHSVWSLENKLHQYFMEQNAKLMKLFERRNNELAVTSSLSGPVTETWNALRKFNGDAGTPGAISLACVTVTALCTLNKRQVVMENAAAVACDRLMHLTSRDGDWFLDELYTMCANISQLLNVLKNNPLRKGVSNNEYLENISCCMQVVGASVKAYNSLQELMSNFRSIIAPEAIKTFLSNDPSVLSITQQINGIVQMSETSLAQLSDHYLACISKKNKMSLELRDTVCKLKEHLEQLAEPGNTANIEANGNQMTAGQMLLAGFNGLFNKVEIELMMLYELHRKIKSPLPCDEWSQEKKNFQLSKSMCYSSNTKWQNFLFVKKLIAIQSFFDACFNQSNATREINISTQALNFSQEGGDTDGNMLRVFNEELLCLPVRQFIAECVQNFMVGLPSHAVTSFNISYVGLLAPSLAKDMREGRRTATSVEELCKKVVDFNLKTSNFPHQHLSQASSLINAHDIAWRKHDLARRLDACITAQKEVVQRAQLQLARYQWLHEETLFVDGQKANQPLANPTKVSVIADIKKRVSSVQQVEKCIPNLAERYNQLEASIEQRLKWASGANPALHSVLQNFADTLTKRKELAQLDDNLSARVRRLATSIVSMEMFKSNTNEADTFNQSIVAAVQKCEETWNSFEMCMGELGDIEQFMKSLEISIPPKEPITIEWMNSRLEKIEGQMKTLRSNQPILLNDILAQRDSLKVEVLVVKSNFTSHHALVGEVKSMLKTLAKDEEAAECLSVRKFIQSHNKFAEDSSIMLKKILALCSASRVEVSIEVAKQSEGDCLLAVEMIKELQNNVHLLHDQLLVFGMSTTIKEPVESEVVSSEEAVTKDDLTLAVSPTNTSKLSSTTVGTPKKQSSAFNRDPKTGKALQEKNTYALSVWRRVKAKLEGRELDNTRRAAVNDQVTHVIDEAIDLDNLCQLYEGWTPWV